MAQTAGDTGTDVRERDQQETKEPDMYRVVLLNDDYTTMDFVIYIIQKVFHKPAAEAAKIMMDVHKKGKGIVGVYPLDIARTKAGEVKKLAQEREYPLECIIEKE
ncbi:MAG: ATP-dependent Clp protease adapter ClpS [Spirochaetia bacterium]